MARPVMKRNAVWVFAAVTAVLLAGCGGPGGSGGGSDELVVSGFSFGAEEFEKTVVAPFEEETGIQVTFDPGSNSDRYNRLLVDRARPDVDVVLISDLFAADGEREGLFTDIDPGSVPNRADTVEFARDAPGQGIPYTFTLPGVLYSTDAFPDGPPTVASLWDPELAGRIAVPDISATAGIPFLIAVAETFGSGPQDVDTAFAKLAELKPNVLQFYSSTTELLSLLERGEVVAAPGLDLFAYDAVEAGRPVAWAPFDRGRVLSYNKAEIVEGAANTDGAQRFVNYLLSPEVQTRTATAFSDKPVNRAATVPPIMTEVAGGAATDPGAAGYVPLDLDFVGANRGAWIDRFAREVSG
ncbi:ABC transporter substrate-binding protein [Pseudonocardia sp. HH130629-09]|uniref:ABC transporter substrate-binding protein n=1 Tax=Pseudonocardia sp. HH130629-09 TaxID=1641402 RepID=UPI0007DC20C7|nr:ABC transporter substrate-binding protein [Pseudonocardia sp. HH130629-09]